jgi:hypothetical protein
MLSMSKDEDLVGSDKAAEIGRAGGVNEAGLGVGKDLERD